MDGKERRAAHGEAEEGGSNEDGRRRSAKRRKLGKGPQRTLIRTREASWQPESSPKHSEIKASSCFDAFYVKPIRIEDAQAEGSPPREGNFSSRDDAQIKSHEGFSPTQCPQGEIGNMSSTPTQIKVLAIPEGTTPDRQLYVLPGHHLPFDLIISNIVASRLPLINLIRARTVCRAWRDAIFSPVIAKSFRANVDCHRPRLVVEHSSSSGPSLAVFDPHVQGWSIIPVPPFGRLVAASSGLFCYVTEAGSPPSLVVGNLLTNQWKHLPAIPLCMRAHGPQIVAMIANESAGSYKVMVLFGMWDDDASDAYLPFMYDSVSEIWACNSTVSARLSFATSRSVKTPDSLLSVDSNAGNLLSYDFNNNVGHTTQVKHLPMFINEEDQKVNLWRRLPQVAVCEGVVFLVARCKGERIPECNLGQLPIVQHSSVGIWMMEAKSEEWQFITCIPPNLLQKIVKGSDGTDFIIASNSGSTLFFVLKGSPYMLAYDSTLYTWTVLPGCPADYNSYPLHRSAFYERLLWISAL